MGFEDPASTDPAVFLAELVESIQRALPGAEATAALRVDRNRSLGDRLAGRPGTVTGIGFHAPDEEFALSSMSGPRWIAEIARVSGGVKISRRSLPLGEWLGALAGRVAAMAADSAGDAAASARALESLGIQPAGSDLRVDDGTFLTDLRALPARLNGRMSERAVASVDKIAELLADTLPRVAGNTEVEFVVRRTGTAYLPDTLRAYLSLPGEWARGHVFPDGTTPEGAFLAQLATIEEAASRLHESAVSEDASALLDNGRFLSTRFPSSGLELS